MFCFHMNAQIQRFVLQIDEPIADDIRQSGIDQQDPAQHHPLLEFEVRARQVDQHGAQIAFMHERPQFAIAVRQDLCRGISCPQRAWDSAQL